MIQTCKHTGQSLRSFTEDTEIAEHTEKSGRKSAGRPGAVGAVDVSELVIGAAVEVHRVLGAGFKESTYEKAMLIELELRGVEVRRQVEVRLAYKGKDLGPGFIDLLVENELVVELKVAKRILDAHRKQVLTYLRAAGKQVGLLINFEEGRLIDGVRRIVV